MAGSRRRPDGCSGARGIAVKRRPALGIWLTADNRPGRRAQRRYVVWLQRRVGAYWSGAAGVL